MNDTFVIKRNGEKEKISFDKIQRRLEILAGQRNSSEFNAYPLNVNIFEITKHVNSGIYPNITTKTLDEFSAEHCASLITEHPDYGILAGRIIISNHQKNTPYSFSEITDKLYNFTDHNGKKSPIVDKEHYDFVMKHKSILDSSIVYNRDYLIDYFGFKTMEKSYFLRINNIPSERPQHLFMRESIAISNNIEDTIINYNFVSKKYFTHATPTLYNSGTPNPQMSSCFLLPMQSDSIDGIYKTLGNCAAISKHAGGIGFWCHNIRANGTLIRGTNGTSNGLIPMLRCFNATARYVDQGGGKRKGSFAVYLEPWHLDIENWLLLKRNTGNEEERARDLFYGLWIPDLFMKRVQEDKEWTLMCPDKCPGLYDCYGDEFETKYETYEREDKGSKTILARSLWMKILESQIETGTPYMLYKDACNQKSNQKNLGTIKCSNLCTEIIEYTGKDEIAVCNLASLSLSTFVTKPDVVITIYGKEDCKYCRYSKNYCYNNKLEYTYKTVDNPRQFLQDTEEELQDTDEEQGNTDSCDLFTYKFPVIYMNGNYIGGYKELRKNTVSTFDYKKLHKVTKQVTRNLNTVIDKNYYPVIEAKNSNMRHRPIGIGVQGLADTFALMRMPFDSAEAAQINKNIFATIYHAAVETSIELAKERYSDMTELIRMTLISRTSSRGYASPKYDELSVDENDIYNELLKKYNPIPEELENIDYPGAYSSFKDSPASKGILQFDLWGKEPSDMWDWESLKKDLQVFGMRNSLVTAPMPTASTAQILGNNECFEPFTENIYLRRVLAGEFTLVNKYLLNELIEKELWNKDLKEEIMYNYGSIQNIDCIPQYIKDNFKTVWEIKQKVIIDMAADRGIYIDQSQSMNLFVDNVQFDKLTKMHFYAWKKGLKTGQYYLRTKPSVRAQQFTIDPNKAKGFANAAPMEPEECENCGA